MADAPLITTGMKQWQPKQRRLAKARTARANRLKEDADALIAALKLPIENAAEWPLPKRCHNALESLHRLVTEHCARRATRTATERDRVLKRMQKINLRVAGHLIRQLKSRHE